MRVERSGDYWILMNDMNEECGRLEVGSGCTEQIAAVFANLQQQGGYRSYDFLTGVMYGMMHTSIIAGLPAYKPPGDWEDDDNDRPDTPRRSG